MATTPPYDYYSRSCKPSDKVPHERERRGDHALSTAPDPRKIRGSAPRVAKLGYGWRGAAGSTPAAAAAGASPGAAVCASLGAPRSAIRAAYSGWTV
jgi:hypothetical protein